MNEWADGGWMDESEQIDDQAKLKKSRLQLLIRQLSSFLEQVSETLLGPLSLGHFLHL